MPTFVLFKNGEKVSTMNKEGATHSISYACLVVFGPLKSFWSIENAKKIVNHD
jgi:hypothetical protein